MQKIVIISSSMRKGNSDKVCDAFEEGARTSNEVHRINIRDLKLEFCLGCRDCYNYGDCLIKDDMNKLYPLLKSADILVFATPIYFGELSGSLKTFIDRMYPLFTSLKGKRAILIASCFQDSSSFAEASLAGLKRCLSDFGINVSETLYALGTDEPNDVSPSVLVAARTLGSKII